MTSSPPPPELPKTGLTPGAMKAQIFGALVAMVVSVGVMFLWQALRWPAQRFAWPLAFFLVMGAFFVWSAPRLRSRPWPVKVGFTLLAGLPGLLVGWLGVVLLH